MNSENSTAENNKIYNDLLVAFNDFQERSEKLSQAYAAMQEDFRKINLELDKKNAELEQSLNTQEEVQTYLNSILESMNNGVIAVDISGKVTLFNEIAEQITGYDSDQVLGVDYNLAFDNKTLSEVNIISFIESGNDKYSDEKVVWKKNGEPLPVSVQYSLLKDAKNNIIGAVEILNDLSRIKSLEGEMRQNRTMAALGEMAATVAHEIRNPLGAMGVWAGLLERDFEKSDPRRETLSKITSALGRLNKIVSNLLVYSRPVKPNFRNVNLKELLEETVNFVEIESVRIGKTITVIYDDCDEETVIADPEKLQQVIMNLALNAVQAIEGKGELTIKCKRASAMDGFVFFSIKDSGEGIDSDLLSKIFDPFHTTKENGTGLGLAIVKKFVDYHSGHISVDSKIGRGTEFKVFLPKA